MKESLLKNILVNIRTFATLNIRKGYNDNAKRIKALEEIAASAEADFKH